MQPLYAACVPVLFVFVCIAQGSMNIGLLIKKAEEEYFKLNEGHIDVSPSPPPHEQAARMARYIVHNSDWCSVSHISLQTNTTGYPMARDYSFSDGWEGFSTGIPYFYITFMDREIQDLDKDGRCSVTISLAQSDYCKQKDFDPEDPRCAQVILTGRFLFVNEKSPEWEQAKRALFYKHPQMVNWPESHHWKIAKLKIGHILVADYFGGSVFPSVEDYFKATPW